MMESIELLLRRAQRFAHATDSEINEAGNLAVALAQFPLALDQAGAYLEETGCSVSDYLEFYHQHRRSMLARRGRQATGYPASVATTWALSFERVTQVNPACAQLLQLCALLAPDRIPEELLLQATGHWPVALQRATADRFGFNQLLEPLLAFSLVKRHASEHVLSIHRLVQAVQMDAIEPEELHQWVHRLVLALNSVFPQEPSSAETWPQCQRYLEQVQACDALVQQQNLSLPEAADLLDRTGSYFLEHSMYSQAETLYRRALAMRERQWGAEHPQVASSLHHLAVLERANGNYAQAEPLFQRALAMREQQLGPDHLETAASLHGLATLYESRRLYDQGEALARRALDIYEQHLGADNLETTLVRNTLGFLYEYQGRFEEAEPLLQHNLVIHERRLGPDHLLTARSLNNLGVLYTNQGRFVEAERLYKRVLAIREQHFGPAHFQTAMTIHNLATLYIEQGRYQEAEPFCERALALYEQHLGPNHVHTADCFIGLAANSLHLGKHAQAEVLARRALELHEAHLGPLHPYVVEDLTILGACSREQGRYAEAESLFQRVLQINAQIPTMPSLLQTALYEFARLREAQGRDEQAADLYQQALESCLQMKQVTHPLTMAIRQHLAALLVRLGRSEEAANLEAAPASSAPAGPQV
jgi:tetratricopeptide (TPR) repeat protein